MVKRVHNTYDYNCMSYLGHNAVPLNVDIYEERCVACDPYTEAEADQILGVSA